MARHREIGELCQGVDRLDGLGSEGGVGLSYLPTANAALVAVEQCLASASGIQLYQ